MVSNIAITTRKFVNKVGTKMKGNKVFKFKQITQSIFILKYNFYIALR